MPLDRLLFGASDPRISHHTDHPGSKWLTVFGLRRLLRRLAWTPEAVRTGHAPEPGVTVNRPLPGDRRQRQVHAAETRLLYDNAFTGIVATIVIAALLAYAQWTAKPRWVVLSWLFYVLLVCAARYTLVRRYRRASPTDIDSRRWSVAFSIGAAMAAAGWVAAAKIGRAHV